MCPLKYGPALNESQMMCWREKCVWWSTTRQRADQGKAGCCAILSIATALDQMLLTGLPVNT
jgi:hypothetical protein